MKRWEIALAVAGAILLALGSFWIRRGELPRQDVTLQAGDCRLPLTILSPLAGIKPAGSVIVLHGLAANRRIMFYLGQDFAGHGFRAYLPNLPGHGDNTQPFSFARAEYCAEQAVATLMRANHLDPANTILLGHSMGGEIAVRMADQIPLASTIAFSPAPMVMPQRMPSNLLVFSAQFDAWQLKGQANALQRASGGDRTAPEDFAQKRAFDLIHVPLATHTSMLDDRAVVHRAELWAMQVLYPRADQKTLALDLDLSTYGTFGRGRLRLTGALIGLIGIFLILPLAISITAKAGGKAAETQAMPPLRHWLILAEGAVGAMVAVLLLLFGTPLRFIHLYAGDYLASEAVIMAIVILLFNRKAAHGIFSFHSRQLFCVAVLAVVVFLALGKWFDWEISSLWLNAPRWIRFAELLPFAWLFCYAEQAVLGALGAGKSRVARFGVFLGLRFEIWLACVIGLFLLASGQILLPILVMQFGAFSIAQGVASDALLRRTGSATAAALFGAILAAWFVAAVFPIT
ncbi:MAG TPA: alpha/beta fold hydrolase [Candidatus Aquilonibacter sp.]|nr:alpha/beta fold hydrolase [Candidatus Aquilonibacter sp.]